MGAVSVAGHARCGHVFNVHRAAGDPAGEALAAQCVGGRDIANQLGVPG